MMSKRFGRNQKRKLLQEVSRCTDALAMESGLREHLSKQNSRLKEEFRQVIETIERICSNSVTLPAKIRQGNAPEGHMRLEIMGTMPIPAICAESSMPLLDQYNSFGYVDVDSLEAYITEHKDTFSKAVHIALSDRKHQVYMISESGLNSISTDELCRRFIPQLINKMLGSMQDKG